MLQWEGIGAAEATRLQTRGPQVAPAPSRTPTCPHSAFTSSWLTGDLGGCHDFPQPSRGPPSARLGLLLPRGASSPQEWGPGARTGGAVTREGGLAGRRARSQQRPGRQGLSAGPCVSTRSRAARAPDARALPASRASPLRACLSQHLQTPGASVSLSQQYGLFKE